MGWGRAKTEDREEGAGGIGLALCPSPQLQASSLKEAHSIPVRTVCALGAAPGVGKEAG